MNSSGGGSSDNNSLFLVDLTMVELGSPLYDSIGTDININARFGKMDLFIHNETVIEVLKFFLSTQLPANKPGKEEKEGEEEKKSISSSFVSFVSTLPNIDTNKILQSVKKEEDLIDVNRNEIKLSLEFHSFTITLYTNDSKEITRYEFGNSNVDLEMRPFGIFISGNFGYLSLVDLRQIALPEYRDIISAGNKEKHENFITFNLIIYKMTKHPDYPGYDIVISCSLNHLKAVMNGYFFISLLQFYMELVIPLMNILNELLPTTEADNNKQIQNNNNEVGSASIKDYDLSSVLPLINLTIGNLQVIIPRYETSKTYLNAGISELKLSNIKPTSKDPNNIIDSLSKLSLKLNNLYISSQIQSDNSNLIKQIILGRSGFEVNCIILKDISVDVKMLPLCFVVDHKQIDCILFILNDNIMPLLNLISLLPPLPSSSNAENPENDTKQIINEIKENQNPKLSVIGEDDEEDESDEDEYDSSDLNTPGSENHHHHHKHHHHHHQHKQINTDMLNFNVINEYVPTTSINAYFTAITLEIFKVKNPYDDNTDSVTVQKEFGNNEDSLALFQIGEMIVFLRINESIELRYQLRDITLKDTRHNYEIVETARNIIKFGALGQPAATLVFNMKSNESKTTTEMEIDMNLSEIYLCPTSLLFEVLNWFLQKEVENEKIEKSNLDFIESLLKKDQYLLPSSSESITPSTFTLRTIDNTNTSDRKSIDTATTGTTSVTTIETTTKIKLDCKFSLTNIAIFFFQNECDKNSFVLSLGIGMSGKVNLDERMNVSAQLKTERLYGCVIKSDLIIPPINDSFSILPTSLIVNCNIKNNFKDIGYEIVADKRLVIRLSYKDIMIMSGTMETLMKCIETLSQPAEEAGTTIAGDNSQDSNNSKESINNNGSIITSGLPTISLHGKISMPGLSALLLVDSPKEKYPILSFTLDKIKCEMKNFSNIQFQFTMYSFYYNIDLAVFEPLIEKWSIKSSMKLQIIGKTTNVELNVKSDKVLEINVSILLLKSLLLFSESITNITSTTTTVIESKGENNNIEIYNKSNYNFMINIPTPELTVNTYSTMSLKNDVIFDYDIIRISYCNMRINENELIPVVLERDSYGYNIEPLFTRNKDRKYKKLPKSEIVENMENTIKYSSNNNEDIFIQFLSEMEYNIWKDISENKIQLHDTSSSILSLISGNSDEKYIKIWNKDQVLDYNKIIDTGYPCNPYIFKPSQSALSRRVEFIYNDNRQMINIDRSGFSRYKLMNENNNKSIFIEVLPKNGEKHVIIRGEYDLINELDIPLKIEYDNDSNENINNGEISYIPTNIIDNPESVITISNDVLGKYTFKLSEIITDKKNESHVYYHTAQFVKETGKENNSILLQVNAEKVYDKIETNDSFLIFTIHFKYPYYIYNTLLYSLKIKFNNKEGHLEKIFSLDSGKYEKFWLEINSLNNIDIRAADTEENLKLCETGLKLEMNKVLKLSIRRGESTQTISVVLERNADKSFSIYLYDEVWIINHSGSDMYCISKKNEKQGILLPSTKVILAESKPEKDEEIPKNTTIPMSFTTTSDNNRLFFTLDKNISKASIEFNPKTVGIDVPYKIPKNDKGEEEEYIIASYLGRNVFSHTSIIEIKPKYWIWNKSDTDIRLKQYKQEKEIIINANTSLPFNWTKIDESGKDSLFQFQPIIEEEKEVDNDIEYKWSGLCRIDTEKIPIIIKSNKKGERKYYTISHTINNDSTVFIIQNLEIENSNYMFYNNTTRYSIIAHPRHCDYSNTIEIKPLEHKGYAWKEPMKSSLIVLSILPTCPKDLNKYKVEDYEPCNTYTNIMSFDKNTDQKIFKIGESEITATVHYENGKKVIIFDDKHFTITSLSDVNHHLKTINRINMNIEEEMKKLEKEKIEIR